MKEEIVESKYDSNDGLTLNNNEKQLNIFRTMYYQLNAKPDSISKVYTKNIIVTNEDIICLNEMIKDKITMHSKEEDGYIVTITVELQNKKVLDFDCWEKYLHHQWVENDCIRSIVIKWNFNVRMPQYELPQNHTIVVKISSGLKPEELLNLILSGKIEDSENIDTNAFPVYARVDFIETLLGEEILNIISGWVRGLKASKNNCSKTILLCRKYRKKVAQCFHYLTMLMIMILFVSTTNFILLPKDNMALEKINVYDFRVFMDFLIIVIVLLFGINKVLNKLAGAIYVKLEEYGRGFTFNITKGDTTKQNEILEKNKKNGTNVIIKIIFSFILDIICAIITSVLI